MITLNSRIEAYIYKHHERSRVLSKSETKKPEKKIKKNKENYVPLTVLMTGQLEILGLLKIVTGNKEKDMTNVESTKGKEKSDKDCVGRNRLCL